MKKVGVIDLGSNTIRLVVYSVKTDGSFRVLLNEKRVIGLSSYVENDKLSPIGIEKALEVLNRHIKLAQNFGCRDIRIFATAVIRNLKNRKRVITTLQKQIGLPIEVLSGKEESHLGYKGATLVLAVKEGILVDIGGGSTELTFIRNKQDVKNLSLNEGCVSTYAEYVTKIFPLKKEQAVIRKAFSKCLKEMKGVPKNVKGELYGIGGSIRALAKLYARIQDSDKTLHELTINNLDDILDLAYADQGAFAHLATKAIPDRIHTILPGCIILREIMHFFNKKTITICKYGVREGYLKEHIS